MIRPPLVLPTPSRMGHTVPHIVQSSPTAPSRLRSARRSHGRQLLKHRLLHRPLKLNPIRLHPRAIRLLLITIHLTLCSNLRTLSLILNIRLINTLHNPSLVRICSLARHTTAMITKRYARVRLPGKLKPRLKLRLSLQLLLPIRLNITTPIPLLRLLMESITLVVRVLANAKILMHTPTSTNILLQRIITIVNPPHPHHRRGIIMVHLPLSLRLRIRHHILPRTPPHILQHLPIPPRRS